jgi:hypothetical protein
VAVDNRLTGDQLAALVTGDRVTIEFVRDFRRPKYVAGRVVRLIGSQIVVSCRMRDGGAKYLHHFDRRGVRIGAGQYAELVAVDVPESASTGQRRQAARVDAAYHEWARNREDVNRLRHLRDAIDDALGAVSTH